MGETAGYTSSTGLMKLSFIFNMSAMVAYLFSFASGNAVNDGGVVACGAIGLLCLAAAVMLHFMLLYLPELENNRGATLASAILSLIAAVFIIISLCVWGGRFGGPGAGNGYGVALAVFAGIFAIGGGVCLILEFTGKYTLTKPIDTQPPPA